MGDHRRKPCWSCSSAARIGNFEAEAAVDFLYTVRLCLVPGDGLLLGTDLVKPIHQLLEAYDDPAGVTAAFNLNLLARINRELGADFHLRSSSTWPDTSRPRSASRCTCAPVHTRR